MRTLLQSLIGAACTIALSSAFTVPLQGKAFTPLFSSKVQPETIQKQTTIKKLDPYTYDTENDEIMQLASYRNNLKSPQQMIDAQKSKQESFDRVASALDGVKIGLGIGAAAGIVTAINGDFDIMLGLQNFAVIGGTTAGLLGYNNYTGNRVYVMNMKEARNRLTVDFVASVKIGQDVGFAAYIQDYTNFMDGRYLGTNGIVGCVDCQLRNSKISTAIKGSTIPSKEVPGLPPHVHLKNMDVDKEVRRCGIARMLVEEVENWGKSQTDAKMMTLEVADSNDGAIKLYESVGFVKDEERKARQRGLSIMYKTI